MAISRKSLIRLGVASATVAAVLALVGSAQAQQPAPGAGAPTGAPPPDAKAVVAAPTAAKEAPKVEQPSPDVVNASLSAGGQLATGNSRLLAGTANGLFDARQGAHGFGASILGNYGRGAPLGKRVITNTENVQGRVRYDYFLIESLSAFLIATGRYDRFQGLDFRLNLDPGFKYLFVNEPATALWAEAGYDYQHDIRLNSARHIHDPTTGAVIGKLRKTRDDHSARLFAGFRHAFSEKVTFTTGLEYLQSFLDSTRYRINYDALFASELMSGFSLGLGFSARYDHDPLPGKVKLDTVTTLNLIYSFTTAKPPEPPPPPVCPECPKVEPAPPPVSEPAPAPPPAAAPVPAPAAPAPAAPPAAAP